MKVSNALSFPAFLLLPVFVATVFAADTPPATAPSPAPAKKAKAPPLPVSKVASPARTTDNVEFVIGPDYACAPECTPRAGVPRGQVHEFTMNSADSKTYPGIAKGQTGTVPYQRQVAVYVPSQYVPGTPAPFIVAQDGVRAYASFLPTILDNLIHEKRLPVMVAIMISSGGGDAQGSQRGLEYDTVSEI